MNERIRPDEFAVLLRLDFNGVLSARIAVDEDGAKSRYVLEEGGL